MREGKQVLPWPAWNETRHQRERLRGDPSDRRTSVFDCA